MTRQFGFVLSALVCFFLAHSAGAQEQLGTQKELTEAFYKKTLRRNALFNGEEQPGEKQSIKEDAMIAEACANWYVYRVTHRGVFKFADVQKDLEYAVADAMEKRHAAKNRAFVNLFAPALVKSMKDVLARKTKDDPTSVINAAMMLPHIAKLKHDAVTEYVSQLADDDKTDAVVRLYAFKALGETLPVTVQPADLDLLDPRVVARKNREIKQVSALTKFIETPVDIKGLPPQQAEAVHFIRREAIASLANAGAPAVASGGKKGKTVEGPIAPTLLRVLSGDVTPPPKLREKLEAALGLCAMKYPNMPEYSPEAGVHLIGQTMLEFTNEYNKDWANFTAPKDKKLPYLPWAGYAKRFSDGLTDLAKNTTGPAKANAEKLEKAAQPILARIIGTSDRTRYGQPPAGSVPNLIQLVNSPAFQPKNAAAFKK